MLLYLCRKYGDAGCCGNRLPVSLSFWTLPCLLVLLAGFDSDHALIFSITGTSIQDLRRWHSWMKISRGKALDFWDFYSTISSAYLFYLYSNSFSCDHNLAMCTSLNVDSWQINNQIFAIQVNKITAPVIMCYVIALY